MRFDDVLIALGEFGSYQKRIILCTCLVSVFAEFQVFMSVFILATPEHRCAILGLENDTYQSQGQWHDALINNSSPWEADNGRFSSCDIYKLGSRNETIRCNQWVYSTETFKSTFVSEIDMVCDQVSMKTYISMIYMAGMLAGSLIFGTLSDIVGRKKVMVVCIVGFLASSVGTGFVDTYIPFVVLRFLTSFFGLGISLPTYVIGMELVGPRKRRYAGLLGDVFWSFACFTHALAGYGLREWRHLQLALSVPAAIMLSYVFIVPESPRWLLSVGRVKEASDVIRKIARGNGADLPEKTLSLDEVELESGGEKIWRMLTVPVLLVRTLVIFLNWIVITMVYYGLSLNASNLSGDLYLNFFLLSVMDLVATALTLALVDRAGRRLLLCGFMLLSGVACTSTLFPVIYGSSGTEWLTLTLSMVGKLGASAAFSVIYIYSVELFPTVMRNSGLGISSTVARVGGILAPYIADIGNYIDGDLAIILPLLIFGALTVTAGLFALILPETVNRTLPDTILDAKLFGRQKVSKNKYEVQTIEVKGEHWNEAFTMETKE